MSNLKNSPFGKRLRAAQQEHDDTNSATSSSSSSPRRQRPRVNPIFASTPSLDSRIGASSSSSAQPESPVDGLGSGGGGLTPRLGRDYGDRFVPSRDAGDMRTSYHLLDESGPSTPSKNRIIPTESDALKEQANAIFTSILHSEVTPPSPVRSASPVRPAPPASTSTSALPPSTPTRRRLFDYGPSSRSHPSTPTRPDLATPASPFYSLSPIRPASQALLSSPRRHLRSVCKTPYRVLDAPDLADDFYLNLVDWSSTNVLGVGLGSCVYLWTAHNAAVSKLCDLVEGGDTVSSVSWVQKGTTLAVGTLSGHLHIYDASTLALLRTYTSAHTQRIGALAWNAHVLSSGSRDRSVHHRDVREPGTRPWRRCSGHRQEVCGLKWSNAGGGGRGIGGVVGGGGSAPASGQGTEGGGTGPPGGQVGGAEANSGWGGGGAALASGGNDNKVCIWDLRGSRRASSSSSAPSTSSNTAPSARAAGGEDDAPLWKFHEHTAAVKALAWDPHVSGVLATGGGTQDKHIRFWNTGVGSLQPNMVPNIPRTSLDTRLLEHHSPKPNMYMEVSLSGHGRFPDRPH
ncbi:hypothetical protein DXG01_007077 [Tephrocybe rancida]|nr:hypothetical protein DXG01_007077 [Tephrocybe rancida]